MARAEDRATQGCDLSTVVSADSRGGCKPPRANAVCPKAINPGVAGAKPPGPGIGVNQRLRLGEHPSDLFFFPHQLHIDLIDRVADAFGCAIVLGLDFLK